MKKFYVIFLALSVVMTPVVQAKSCILNGCQYITNATFSSGGTGWTSGGGNGVSFPTVNSCGATNTSAQLDNTEYIQQSFYVDDTYVEFHLNFDLYLLNDSDEWYDQLKVTVTDNTTNATETFYFHGSSFDDDCTSPQVSFQLSNNYSLHNVTVKFENSYLALGSWQIDNVGFWGFK